MYSCFDISERDKVEVQTFPRQSLSHPSVQPPPRTPKKTDGLRQSITLTALSCTCSCRRRARHVQPPLFPCQILNCLARVSDERWGPFPAWDFVSISFVALCAQVKFSYSVKWKPTSLTFERRMEKYSKYSFLPQHLEVPAMPSRPL